MILEAFSIRLRAETEAMMAARLNSLKPESDQAWEISSSQERDALPPQPSAHDILETWLTELLRTPLPIISDDRNIPYSQQNAAWQARHLVSVIHTEVARLVVDGRIHFQGRSPSGQRLLDTLQEYCDSYDHWLFSRWLHHLQASDFDSAPKPPPSIDY